MKGITLYVAFWIGFFLLSEMHLGFIYVVECVNSTFLFFFLNSILLYGVPQLVYPFSC